MVKQTADGCATSKRRDWIGSVLALEPGIKDGLPSAIGAAVRVMERCAKLFGLDASTTTQLTGPDGAMPVIRMVKDGD